MRPSNDIVAISNSKGIEGVDRGEDQSGISGIYHQHDSKSNTPIATHTEHAQDSQHFIPMVNRVLWEPEKKVKVISIGCGFSGLTLAQKIQHKYKLDHKIDHTIYEKNCEIGGTWFEVSYSCCHFEQFSNIG